MKNDMISKTILNGLKSLSKAVEMRITKKNKNNNNRSKIAKKDILNWVCFHF